VNQEAEYLFHGRQVEEQIRLDERLGIFVKEGHLLRRETTKEAAE
jgi:hypothetical protein